MDRPTAGEGMTNMNRLLRVIVIAGIGAAPFAHADDISANITYVTAFMGPNAGSGDNISMTLMGPRTLISAGGGMACWDWCSGSWVPNGTPVVLSQVFAGPFYDSTIAGVTYDFGSVSLDC